jgi:multicomponent Na+:H+ antiporter subunit E
MPYSLQRTLSRAAWFVALWIIVAGVKLADLPAAAVAIGTATWASLVLLPPRAMRVSISDLLRMVLNLLRQSVVAGFDVAWRAFQHEIPLKPGFIRYPAKLRERTGRDVLCTILSLCPGTLPIESEDGSVLVIHCLDVEQPISRQIEADEALLAKVLGAEA